MGHLYDVREKAISHVVEQGDTLATIALRYENEPDVPDDLDWKEIALYNWATADEAQVVRALCERVGSSVPDAIVGGSKPEDLALDPAFGPSAPEPILVPKLWKAKGLDVKRKHTIEVRRRTPASAIGITKLDKWFIPVHETCDVDYGTQGDPAHADAVELEVYASNYAKLTGWNGGLPEFDPLPDVPVYAAEAKDGEVRDWYGVSKCDQGALSPDGHPLNVAFSPYTVVLRYAKKGTHGDARIALEPFWVAFDGDGKPLPDSCKIAWKIHNADVKLGLLLIADRTGTIVLAKGLNAADLEAGAYEWDGNDAAGRPVVAGKMPYRVQIQAHTGIDTEDGLALAAMHTEVRLYVHEDTLALDQDPYDPTTDGISLDFSIADVWPKDDPPERNQGSLWTKYELAEAGFHPGPVNDDGVDVHFETALHELQRSVPKGGGSGGAPFERMAVGDDDDDTKDALAGLEASRKRPWFGKPADVGATIELGWRPESWPTTDADDFLARLRDPEKRMIVWVDDRNWYTDGAYWHDGYYDGSEVVSLANLAKIHADPADLGGDDKVTGRGSFEDRDDRVGYDVRDIARPWIPLQVDFRLLSKAQELDAKVDAHPPELAEKVRAAIGPLRVDWTFDEIEKTSVVAGVTESHANLTHALPELDLEIDAILSKLYHPAGVRHTYGRPEASRTRMALRWALDRLKAEHVRKDVTRTSLYFNAPEAHGGIRPDDPDRYFEAVFGQGGESLAPWTGKADGARQSIGTAVHDRVGQDENEVFGKRLGRAGIYFHPSRIAGDGYQVRAQVRFDAAGPYVCPNADGLRARYARLPQAQTVQFRLWRKTSIRGMVKWAPAEDWSIAGSSCYDNLPRTGPNEWRAHYTACHVSIENELGVTDDELKLAASSLFATEDDYFDLVADTLKAGDRRKQPGNRNWMTLSDDYAWPWSADPWYGVRTPSFKARFGDAVGELMKKLQCDHVSITIRMSLAIVKAIEASTGRMRGHVLVQYQTTPNCHFRQYRCPTCKATPTYLQDDPGDVMSGEACPVPPCTGALAPYIMGYYECSSGHRASGWESTSAGGDYRGRGCGTCSQPLDFLGVDEPAYSHSSARGRKAIPGLPSPSCGFPVGVFWNFAGDATLWAHELGHNRHYEHAADAMQNPMKSARGEHDDAGNAFITHAHEKPANTGWDRACLMSYVNQVTDTRGNKTYDVERDMPSFCFKCVLKNRGWRLAALPTPGGDMQDVTGV